MSSYNDSAAMDEDSNDTLSMVANSRETVNHNHLFVATVTDAKSICDMLVPLLLDDKSCLVSIVLGHLGFRAITEKNHVMQASAFLQKSLFKTWSLKDETDVEFRVDLKHLLYCLGVFTAPISDGMFYRPAGYDDSRNTQFTPSTEMKIVYHKVGYPLELTLDERGVTTRCQVTVYDRIDNLAFEVWPDDVAAQLAMDSDLLTEIWSELDFSSDILSITVRESPPLFQLSTKSDIGCITSTIGLQSEKIMKFVCTQEFRTTYNYDMPLMKKSLKALATSKRVNMRIGNNGTICVHYMITLPDNVQAFVEYYCCALVD